MNKNINYEKIKESCDTLARRVVSIEGKRFVYVRAASAFLFDQCMRAFDNSRLPAQAVTFSVYINAPVNKDGEATIYRDGTLTMKTV